MTDTSTLDLPLISEPRRNWIDVAMRLIGPAMIALAGVIMLVWTWGGWADPLANNGRELYLPWQIVKGQVLYRDLPHIHGPFSQYFNAMVFAVFGVSVRALVVSNLIWLSILLVIVYRLWTIIADRIAATAACLTLVLLFAFMQLTFTGGFNFVLPYSHEMTHGVILSFGAIAALSMYLSRGSNKWLAVCGLLLGLVFLTKAEVFAAAATAVLSCAAIAIYRAIHDSHRATPAIAALAGGLFLPPIIAVILLSLAMPPTEALDGVFGGWRWAFDESVTGLHNFQHGMGVDSPGGNLDRILLCMLAYVSILAPPAVVGILVRRRGGEGRLVALVITVLAIAVIFYILHDMLYWQYALAGLVLVMIGLTVTFAATILQRPRRAISDAMILRLTVCAFALLLLARMGLRVVVFEYGFAIAMPVALVMVAAFVSWLPRAIELAGGFGWIPRAGALILIAITIQQHLGIFGRNFNQKSANIGSGADALQFDPRGFVLRDMLAQLDARADRSGTLLVLPEGALLNYYSGRTNPIGYVSLTTPDMIMFGPQSVVGALRRAPPDWVVTARSDSAPTESRSRAGDSASDVWDWVRDHYREVAITGDKRFWMKLYQRKDAPGISSK